MAETTTVTEKKDDKPIALKLSGAGYILGDLGGLAASHARGNPDSFKGYAVWLAGGIAAALFGNPSQETQLKLTAHKLQNYLTDRGVAIPKDAREQDVLLKKPHFLSAVTDFLHEHPSEMLNSMFAVGAGFLLKDGIKEARKLDPTVAIKKSIEAGEKLEKDITEKYRTKSILPKLPKAINAEELSKFASRTNNLFWMGMLVGAGALSGLLIKENHAAREEAKDGGFVDKTLAYIKEKPLRLTSLLYGANNIFATLNAVSDYHDRGKYTSAIKPHIFSGTMAASYILSNILLHSVSRDQSAKGGYDTAEMARLEEMAATVIAAQPAEKQQQALQEVSAFLATQKNIGLQAPQIAEHLANRIAEKSKAHLLAVQPAPMPVAAEEAPKSFAEKENARRIEAEHTAPQIS